MARRARGYRTTSDLAAAIDSGKLTEAVLENIEAGRKADLSISQVLNIAMTLKVPVSYLLAPLTRPDDPIDLPNLSTAFSGMTAGEFDSWLAAIPTANYRADLAAERNDRAELQALRELATLHRELRRLTITSQVLEGVETAGTGARIADTKRQIANLIGYLRSAGWDVANAEETHGEHRGLSD
jgi:hypothetical protein